MIQFKEYLNSAEIELCMVEKFKSSLERKKLDLDLSNVTWLSPFTLSILCCWIYEAMQNECVVRLWSPQKESFASYFFRTVNVNATFREMGVIVESDPPGQGTFGSGKLAAFDIFKSQAECEDYVSDLLDESQQETLLHTSVLPEIVRSGHFAKIVIRELGDNTFTHAKGLNSHFTAFESEPAKVGYRENHPIFADFGGQSYIEICVGDSSKRNIVQTLQKHLPIDYTPDIDLQKRKRPLNKIERTLMYAFEYGSTSNQKARLDKIQAWLNQKTDDPSQIATGLYNNLLLARLYKGQLIFRLSGVLGTLDYSNVLLKGALPRVSFLSSISDSPLIALKGSIVALRIPTQRSGAINLIVPPSRPDKKSTKVSVSVTAPFGNMEKTNAQTIFPHIENAILTLAKKGKSSSNLIACCLDGLEGPSMILQALIVLIAGIPRRGRGLLVTIADAEQLELAKSYSEKIGTLQKKSGGHHFRHPSLVVAYRNQEAIAVYGSLEHPEATTLKDGEIILPDGSVCDLASTVNDIRKTSLEKTMTGKEICHTENVFLIEGNAYYTNTFFEVRHLIDSTSLRPTLKLWLAHIFGSISPRAIVYNTTFFKTILEESVLASCIAEQPVLFANTEHSVSSTVLDVIMLRAPGEKVVIVLDVLCTGRFLKKFIDAYPKTEELVILAIVDARKEDTKYLTVSRTDGSIDVPVISVLKKPIDPIYDRPPGIKASEVFVIDSVTHAPTKYPLPIVEPDTEKDLLDRMATGDAVLAGHYALDDKHYVYFMPFQKAFVSLNDNIQVYLQNEEGHLVTTAGVDISKTNLYCLDENTGLYELAEKTMRGRGIGKVSIIDRGKLHAPPISSTGEVTWFLLPALASGKTVQQCLEYANSVRAKFVFISVIVARVDTKTLLFYQNVTKYRDMKICIHCMLHLPLTWFVGKSCPVCVTASTIERRLEKLSHTDRLQALLMRAADDEKVTHITNAGGADLSQRSEEDQGIAKEMYLMALYYRAELDISTRTSLKKELTDQDSVEAFATGVGRAAQQEAFHPEEIKGRIYDTSSIDIACKTWIDKSHVRPRIFALQLRGFTIIAPVPLRDGLEQLLKKNIDNKSIFEVLLAEACIQTELFWEALDNCPKPSDTASCELYEELIDYVRRNGTGKASEGLFRLHELRELLYRSPGWGNTIQDLSLALNAPDTSLEIINKKLSIYLNEGFKVAQRRYSALRKTRLWISLKLHVSDIESAWIDLCNYVKEFESSISSGVIEEAKSFYAKLEHKKNLFISLLDSIAVRPGPALEALRQLAPSAAVPTSDMFEVHIADNCPSIAMLRQDFMTCMVDILSNAKHAGDHKNITHFKFLAHDAVFSKVMLEVSQTAMWRESSRLEGGLHDIRSKLSIYGGSIKIDKKATPGTPFMYITFLSWPIYHQIQ